MDSSVSVRDLQPEDIPMVLDYWFRSPPGYLESRGVDLNKMPIEDSLKEMLEGKCRGMGPKTAVTILYKNVPIGIHTLTPLVENEYGVFHAHIIRPEFRGRGIAAKSYPLACKGFSNDLT